MFDDLNRTIEALLKAELAGDVASQVSIGFATPDDSLPPQGLSLPAINLFLVRSPKDKLVIYDSSATNRYGIGLNDSNINLFYSTFAHFSLRQNSTQRQRGLQGRWRRQERDNDRQSHDAQA